jgi:hypothetical protein
MNKIVENEITMYGRTLLVAYMNVEQTARVIDSIKYVGLEFRCKVCSPFTSKDSEEFQRIRDNWVRERYNLPQSTEYRIIKDICYKTIEVPEVNENDYIPIILGVNPIGMNGNEIMNKFQFLVGGGIFRSNSEDNKSRPLIPEIVIPRYSLLRDSSIKGILKEGLHKTQDRIYKVTLHDVNKWGGESEPYRKELEEKQIKLKDDIEKIIES